MSEKIRREDLDASTSREIATKRREVNTSESTVSRVNALYIDTVKDF